MSEVSASTTSVVLEVEDVSFTANGVDLKRLHRELAKGSKKAVEVLLTMMNSPDDKIRLTAATRLLDYEIDVAKAISADQMQRLIAEVRLNGDKKKKLIEVDGEDGKPMPPRVDFSTIRSIE